MIHKPKINRIKGEKDTLHSDGADNTATAVATRRTKMITLTIVEYKILKILWSCMNSYKV